MTTIQEESIITAVLEQRLTDAELSAAQDIVAAGLPHQSIVIDMLAGAEKPTDSLKGECYNALLAEIEEKQLELDAHHAAACYRRLVHCNSCACCNKKPRE